MRSIGIFRRAFWLAFSSDIMVWMAALVHLFKELWDEIGQADIVLNL